MPCRKHVLPDLDRLLTTARGHQALQAVAAAVRIGLFACIAEKPAAAGVIAQHVRCSSAAVARLLHCLCGLGLVRQHGTAYGLSGAASRYLNPARDTYIGFYLLHQATLVEPWANLAQSLTRNRMQRPSPRRIAGYHRQLALYLRAMDCLGRLKTRRIMQCIDIRRCRNMLDLGCGMGTYAIAFVRSHSRLRATVADLPDVVRHARAAIRANGCAGRVTAVACRVPDEPLPAGPFDLVFVSNLLHLYQPDECRRILMHAAAVLERGGVFAVHDYLYGCGDNAAVGLFDLTMLVGTPRGQCYRRKEIVSWMRAAGIIGIRTAAVPAGTAVVWGRKG